MIYDYIIVGGGVSGLYIYLNMLKSPQMRNKKIVLLEKMPNLGGRIYTDNVNSDGKDYFFEAGAGRFAESHKRLKKLLIELDLYNKKMKIPNDINFIDTQNKNLHHHTYYLDKIVKKFANKKNDKKLNLLTMKELLKKEFSPKIVKYIVNSYEYKDFFITNAYEAINNYYKNFKLEEQYYILGGGLTSIINKMERKLKKMNAKIKKNVKVLDVVNIENDNYQVKITHGKNDTTGSMLTKNIIFTLTNNFLKDISVLKDVKKSLINSVDNTPLTRIYSVFDTKDLWFKDLKKTTTTSPIQYLIPINEKEGSIMSSYTDMGNAKMWFKLYKESPKKMEKKLLKELSKMYGIDIPNPKFNKLYHWQNGVGHWKKGYNTKFVKKHISKPFKDKNIFIAGENYSSYQGWIEGALETSQIVLKKILKKSKLKTRKYKKKTRNKTLKK